MNKLAVIALGGNALLRGDQIGTIEEQEQNTIDTLENLIFLIKEGYIKRTPRGREVTSNAYEHLGKYRDSQNFLF